MVREEFGEVDGIAGVDAEGDEAEEGQEDEHLGVALGQVADGEHHEEAQEVHDGEGAFATKAGAEGAEAELTDACADDLNDAVSELGAFVGFGGLDAEREEEFTGEVLGGDADAPEGAQADGGEGHAEEGAGSPTGIAKEFGEAAHGFAAGFGLVPGVGFFDGTANPDGEESREDADEVGDAPFVGDFHGGEGGEPGAEDTGGVEDATGVSAGVFGEDFSNEGGGDGPLTTDAHGDEEAKDTDVPELGGEVGEAGEDGVKEDGEDHDGLAADFVAE